MAKNSGKFVNQEHLVVWLKNTLYICVDELFCQRRRFTWTRYPIFNPNLFFHTRYSPLQDVGNSGKNLFIYAQVGNKNVHDITHGKLRPKGVKCLDQDKMAKLLLKVPVYFQPPKKISKMFLIVFV